MRYKREKVLEYYKHVDNGGYTFTIWKESHEHDESCCGWYFLEVKNSFYGYAENSILMREKVDGKFFSELGEFFSKFNGDDL